MDKIKLEIVSLAHSVSQTQSYAVVLGEKGGRRRLPIVIGAYEAQAIAVAMEKITPTRPLTHDLIRNIFELLDIKLREIIINNLKEGIFYSKLICVLGGKEIEIDSRTSDGLALAVRFDCPIYTYEFILGNASITLEDSELEISGETTEDAESEVTEVAHIEPGAEGDFSGMSIDELNAKLQEVLEREEYERAIRIRDEIDKRRRENT